MRANRGKQDARDGGMGEGSTRGEGIGGGASWGGDDAAVGLNDGEEFIVAVKLEVRDIGGGAAVDDQFVENFKLFPFNAVSICGAVVFAISVVVLIIRNQSFSVFLRLGRKASIGGAVDGAGEPHSKIDQHAVITHDAVEMGLVGGEFEVRQEAEGAEGEGKNRGNDTLEEPGGEQDGTIATESEDEIEFLRRLTAKIWSPILQHALVPRI